MSRSGHILNSTGVTARLLNLISGFIAKQTKTRPACASAYEELSTPLAGEHFTGHRKGAIYGTALIGTLNLVIQHSSCP